MKVLLFGGGGFLGRHIHACLAAHAEVLAPTRQDCDLAEIDHGALVRLLRRVRPEAIVIAAGRTFGTATELLQAHTMVTAKLIDAIALAAPQARLVRIGSAAEYGPVPHGHTVREDDPARPVGEYGLSHLTATALVELAGSAGRVDGRVLRVFNPVGPGMPKSFLLARAALLFREAIRAGAETVDLGLHAAWRDFIDVRDVASATWAAVRTELAGDRVFNIGSGRALSLSTAIDQLAETAGYAGVVAAGPFAPEAARSAAVGWMCADRARAERILDWVPMHPLADSLTELWTDINRDGPTGAETSHRQSSPAARRRSSSVANGSDSPSRPPAPTTRGGIDGSGRLPSTRDRRLDGTTSR